MAGRTGATGRCVFGWVGACCVILTVGTAEEGEVGWVEPPSEGTSLVTGVRFSRDVSKEGNSCTFVTSWSPSLLPRCSGVTDIGVSTGVAKSRGYSTGSDASFDRAMRRFLRRARLGNDSSSTESQGT